MRAFKDDIFDALGFVGYSNELTEKQKIDIINYIKKNFVVSVDGKKKNLALDRFVFEGSDLLRKDPCVTRQLPCPPPPTMEGKLH